MSGKSGGVRQRHRSSTRLWSLDPEPVLSWSFLLELDPEFWVYTLLRILFSSVTRWDSQSLDHSSFLPLDGRRRPGGNSHSRSRSVPGVGSKRKSKGHLPRTFERVFGSVVSLGPDSSLRSRTQEYEGSHRTDFVWSRGVPRRSRVEEDEDESLLTGPRRRDTTEYTFVVVPPQQFTVHTLRWLTARTVLLDNLPSSFFFRWEWVARESRLIRSGF